MTCRFVFSLNTPGPRGLLVLCAGMSANPWRFCSARFPAIQKFAEEEWHPRSVHALPARRPGSLARVATSAPSPSSRNQLAKCLSPPPRLHLAAKIRLWRANVRYSCQCEEGGRLFKGGQECMPRCLPLLYFPTLPVRYKLYCVQRNKLVHQPALAIIIDTRRRPLLEQMHLPPFQAQRVTEL